MASLLDQYYEQIQGLNRQRQMTGNQAFNRGAMGEITQGYLDTQYNKEDQRRRTAMAEEAQAFNQANTLQNREDAKSAQTTSLISSAVGGAAQLGTQLYGVNRLTGGQRTPAVNRVNTTSLTNAVSPAVLGTGDYADFLYDPAPLTYGSAEYATEAARWGVEESGSLADTSFLDDVFSWFGSWF